MNIISRTQTHHRSLLCLPASLLCLCAMPAWGQSCDPTLTEVLYPLDPGGGESFGYSLAADGDYAVIGAPDDSRGFGSAGSASVYQSSGGGRVFRQLLITSDNAGGDFMGNGVAISGQTIVVGTPGDDDLGSRSGSAYVFELQEGEWVQTQKLLPDDGSATDFFGGCVSIDADTIVIGAERDDDNGTNAGSAYVFARENGQWSQQAHLLASDGIGYDSFGRCVAVSGSTIVVGAPESNDLGNSSGAAYIFTTDGTKWTQQDKVTPGDGASTDNFATSVAIRGELMIVGSPYNDAAGANAGAAYVLRRHGTRWISEQKLTASAPQIGERFGTAVDIQDGLALVGAIAHVTDGRESGAAYVFADNGVGWTPQPVLAPASISDGGRFGGGVAIVGESMFVGASQNFHNGLMTGSVYTYLSQCSGSPCPADFSQDGELNFFDVSRFLQHFLAQDPSADFNADGAWNFFDVSGFLVAFSSGCP